MKTTNPVVVGPNHLRALLFAPCQFACTFVLLASSLVLHAQSSASSGTIITIAGNGSPGAPSGDGGPATNAVLAAPLGLAVSRDGTLYFDELTDGISAVNFRSINPSNGIINTIASASASSGLGMNRFRHKLYFPNFDAAVVSQINLSNNVVNSFAGVGWFYPFPLDDTGYRGDGGPANEAWFSTAPWAVSTDGAGNVYIAEGSRIRKVTIDTGIITTICGRTDPCCGGLNDVIAFSGDGGPAVDATLVSPFYIASDRAGDLFIIDLQSSGARFVRRIDAATGIINTIAGTGTNSPATAGPAVSKTLADLQSIAVNEAGTELFLGGIARVYRIDLVTGILSPYAGNGTNGFNGIGDGGPALNAEFGNNGISGLLVPPGGGLLISDYGNSRIRYVAPNSITLTNAPGPAEFHLPWVNSLDGDLIVSGNTNVIVIDLGSLTDVAGSVDISGNTAAVTIGMGSATNVAGSVTIDGNTNANTISMGSLTSVGGSVDLSDNSGATTISLGSVGSVAGSVNLTGNTAAGSVDLDSLTDVGGAVSIGGNSSAGSVDLGSLTNVCGDITITNNAPDAMTDLSSLSTLGCDTNAVTMTVDGTVMVADDFTVETNATLAGSATVDGSVTNDGTISPGSSPGRFNITGQLTLRNSSRLNMEIAGYDLSAFDSVAVQGEVALGGTLSVSLLGGFPNVMANGDSFTILTAGGPITGTFANVVSGGSLITTDGRASFTVVYAGQTTVRLINLLIIDRDGDGATDEAELAAGTDPFDPESNLHLLNVQPDVGGLRIEWSAVGGKSYVVQRNEPLSGGGFLNNFTDFSSLISVPGTGESVANIVDPTFSPAQPGHYYRVRLGP